MTGEQVGIVMILIGLSLFLLVRGRKRQNSPGRSDVVFLDVMEIRGRRKVPNFLLNLAFVVGILALIWVTNH